MMNIELAYGDGRITAEVPENATVMRPRSIPTLPDESGALWAALARPMGTKSLADILHGKKSVAIVTPDITRPLPTARILRVLLPLIRQSGIAAEQVVLVNGTGSHRGNTSQELSEMYGSDVVDRYRIVNHDAYQKDGLAYVGRTAKGCEAWLNREFVEAEVKIVLGLIEPHFFAGFSGGAKGIYPALAGIDSIMGFHNAQQIGHPRSTWGLLEGNPHQIECQSVWDLVHPDFLLNVTVNQERGITGVFAGSLAEAFFAGADYARSVAMTGVEPPGFDIVVTTNSGYPLDQNLYQTVKGISAAAKVVRPGGAIVCAAECREGYPDHGEFRSLMEMAATPQELLDQIAAPGFRRFDQWEAQTLASILTKAEVWLYSAMDPLSVERAMLHPTPSVEEGLASALAKMGPNARVGILPEGPMTIPYVMG
jgi:nickel-dependent lactate racemase